MSQQHRSALFLGFLNVNGNTVSTFALNTAASGGFSASWLAYSWNPSESKTLNAVKVFCSAVAGTLAATDLVCDIYSDTAGTGPNASLATSSTVTATPTTAAWVEFTGFSLALTAGTQYWIVLRNANAAPATNAPTYRYGQVGAFVAAGAGDSNAGFGCNAVKTSVNSGGAWSSSTSTYSCGWRVQYSDGTYDGLPISNIAAPAAASGAFGKQAVGVQFVTPQNAVLNVRGVQLFFTKSGTPGNAVYKLYNASTLLGTTTAIPVGNVSTGRMYAALFSSTLTVNPGTTLNLVVADLTTADTNSNRYQLLQYAVDNDANSFALMPCSGTLRLTTTTDYTAGSPSFSTDQTFVVPFSLILDSTGEFASGGGSGGVVGTRIFTGF